MPSTNPGGWPYLLPEDHPLEYPAHTQQLATLLDTGMQGVLTPASGWAEYGAAFTGLFATRMGPLVTIEAMLKRTGANISLVVGTNMTIATLPVGFRPLHTVVCAGVLAPVGGASNTPCRLDFTVDGSVIAVALATGTMTQNSGWAFAAGTFRGD